MTKSRTAKKRLGTTETQAAPLRSIPTERAAMWAMYIRSFKAVTGAIDRDLAANAGLTLAEYELLLSVFMLGGRARFIYLAKLNMLSQSRISRQIDAVKAKGLIEREATSTNRRATYAVLTPKGSQALEDAHQHFVAALNKSFLDLIRPGETAAFSAVLERLTGIPNLVDHTRKLIATARDENGLDPKLPIYG